MTLLTRLGVGTGAPGLSEAVKRRMAETRAGINRHTMHARVEQVWDDGEKTVQEWARPGGPMTAHDALDSRVTRLRNQGHKPVLDGLSVAWTEHRELGGHTITETTTLTYTPTGDDQ